MSWPLKNKTSADDTYTPKSIRTDVLVRSTTAGGKGKYFQCLGSKWMWVCVCVCLCVCVEKQGICISIYLFITIHPAVCCPAFLINKYQ